MDWFNEGLKEAKPIVKAVACLPFNATEGALIENGMKQEEAHACAYRYVDQKLSVTIAQVGVASGKGLAALLKEDNLDDAVSRIEQTQ